MNSEMKAKTINVIILPTQSPENEKLPDPKSFWHIDKEMLRFKVHFFLYVGGMAAGLPYIVVFAKNRLGISAASLGAVLTTQMFLIIFTKPTIGYIADYFNKLKIIISTLIAIYMACFLTLLAIPRIESESIHQNISKMELNASHNYRDISDTCEKYNAIFLKTFSPNYNNVSSLYSSNSNISTFTLPYEDGKCSFFPENDFESFLLYYHELYTFYKEHSAVSSEEDIISSKEISINFTIVVFVYSSNNSKMCMCSSIFRQKDSSVNTTQKKTVESCTFPSESLKKNSITSNGGDFVCVPSDFQNMTLDFSETEIIYRAKDVETYQFWTFALLYTTAAVCLNAIFTLSDTACCESLQKTGADFGQQRLWGGIGWGLIAPLAGFINDYTKGFLASFLLMGAMMVLFIWNMSKIDLVKPHYSKNILKDVGTVLKSKDFLIFEALIFVNGLGTGLIWYYLIWFLTSIGGSELLCGLTLTVQSFLGVIPFMFFSGWIIKKVGHLNILTIALVGYTIRFLWYSYLQNPWIVLPVEFLHGITYGLYYTALASYAKLSAKPGTEATTQAIVFSTHEGLGSGIGCVLGGIGFDYFGGHQTFFYSSMICACGVLISLCLSLLLLKRKKVVRLASSQETCISSLS